MSLLVSLLVFLAVHTRGPLVMHTARLVLFALGRERGGLVIQRANLLILQRAERELEMSEHAV